MQRKREEESTQHIQYTTCLYIYIQKHTFFLFEKKENNKHRMKNCIMNKVDKGRSCTTRFFLYVWVCVFFSILRFLKELAAFFLSCIHFTVYSILVTSLRDWYGFGVFRSLSHRTYVCIGMYTEWKHIFVNVKLNTWILIIDTYIWVWVCERELVFAVSVTVVVVVFRNAYFLQLKNHQKWITIYKIYNTCISFIFISFFYSFFYSYFVKCADVPAHFSCECVLICLCLMLWV